MIHSPRSHVFLTGMMGAGKSTVGRTLASVLGAEFIDLDDAIEVKAEASIGAIFEEGGEATFRALEAETLAGLLDREGSEEPKLRVIALGGGTYVQPGVAERLAAHGPTLYLDAPLDVLSLRLEAESEAQKRPLKDRLEAMHAQRHSTYQRAQITLDATAAPERVARRALDALGQGDGVVGLRSLRVELGERSYPIWLVPGTSAAAARLVDLLCQTRATRPARLAVLSDVNVASRYLEPFAQALEASGYEVTSIVVPAGERSKSISTFEEVLETLAGAAFTRSDMIVALGGGVVGDLSGFTAACTLRGVDFIQVPTTVLAQVDSAVGGKTGINLKAGKNLVGAFHQPIGVVMAMDTLRTLPPQEVASGFGEIIKYGLLDANLLERLERDPGIEALSAAPWSAGALIAHCCAIKAGIVARDEREAGARALLNLGHTFGHAIEAIEGFGEGGITHGAAVALGIIIAAESAHLLGLSDEDSARSLRGRVQALCARGGLKTDPTPWLRRPVEMARFMLRDKKRRGSAITLVIPVKPGDVRLHSIKTEHIDELVRRLAATFGAL